MTAFTEFYDVIRALLDDSDDDINLYEDSQINKSMKLALGTGKVSTATATYRFSGNNVTPDLTIEGDAEAWAQMVYHAAKTFCTGKRTLSWRTRAFAESVGDNREAVTQILDDIYKLENGAMMGSEEL